MSEQHPPENGQQGGQQHGQQNDQQKDSHSESGTQRRHEGNHARQAYDEAVSAGAAEVAAGAGNESDGASAEAARLKEALLRLRADMDNREKRMERETAKVRRFAVDALLRDLIPVLDTLDQAIETSAPDAQTLREGMELTRKQLIKALTGHGLEVIHPLGERFDPTWHEAMTMRPAGEEAVDTVVEVLQKGYSLNERLIRPARVVVAK